VKSIKGLQEVARDVADAILGDTINVELNLFEVREAEFAIFLQV